MKKISLYYIMSLMAIIFVSCATQSVISLPTETKNLSIDEPQRELKYRFEKRIPLKLDGEDVISGVQKIVYQDGNFYIQDRRQNFILQFDNEGNLKNKLAKVGSGPGEYIRINTFDVTDEGLIYILDSHGRKINVYDTNSFDFKFSIPTDFLPLDLGVIDKDNIFVGQNIIGRNKPVKLGKIGKNDAKIKPILDYKYDDESELFNLTTSRFYRSGDNLVYYNRFSDAIYTLDNDSLKQIFTVVSSKLPNQEQVENLIAKNIKRSVADISKDRHSKNNNDIVWDITNIYFTPSWIYMTPQTHPLRHLFINRKTNEVVTASAFYDHKFDENFKRCRIGAMGVCEDNFITLQSPEEEDDDYSLVLFSIE